MARPNKLPGLPPDQKAAKAKQVIDGMLSGLSCYKACAASGVAHSTFLGWVDADPQLADKYAQARHDLIERMATDIVAIADEPVGSTESGATDTGAVQKQRLQIDTRKWLLSKLAPKRYGERLEVAGDADAPLQVQVVKRMIVDPKSNGT